MHDVHKLNLQGQYFKLPLHGSQTCTMLFLLCLDLVNVDDK